MGWGYWETYKSRPRRPANGIKAQTQRGQFGKTWWAGRWIAALERLVDPSRLSRGRSYARSGQVVQLDVGPEGVDARVQGSQPKPYAVSVRFKHLSDQDWEKVADAMAAQAIFAARLLSGEMPEQIEDVFEAAGTSLFPAAGRDMTTSCSCPDWANPCKHVAAVHYLLGERFDADPFLMFELRGRGKDDVIAALRARRAGGTPAESAAVESTEEAEPVPPLAASLDDFWSSSANLADLTWSLQAPSVDALPIKRLGAPPFWRGQSDFATLMEASYRAIATHARRVMLGGEEAISDQRSAVRPQATTPRRGGGV